MRKECREKAVGGLGGWGGGGVPLSSPVLLLFPPSLHFAPLDLLYRTGAQNRLN